MCVCVCVCVCVRVYVVCMCMCMCVYVCMYVCVCGVYVCMCVYVWCVYVCMCVCVWCVRACVCACVCVCMCVCTVRELYNHMWDMSIFRSQMAIHQKIMCYVITAMVKCTRNMLSFLQRKVLSRSTSISMKLNSVMHWGPRQKFISLVSESKNKYYCW